MCSTHLQSGPLVVSFRHEMFNGSVFAVTFKLIISICPPGLLHRLRDNLESFAKIPSD